MVRSEWKESGSSRCILTRLLLLPFTATATHFDATYSFAIHYFYHLYEPGGSLLNGICLSSNTLTIPIAVYPAFRQFNFGLKPSVLGNPIASRVFLVPVTVSQPLFILCTVAVLTMSIIALYLSLTAPLRLASIDIGYLDIHWHSHIRYQHTLNHVPDRHPLSTAKASGAPEHGASLSLKLPEAVIALL